MTGPLKRAVVSLAVPVVLLAALPAAVILLRDPWRGAWLAEPPRSAIVSVLGLALIVLGLGLMAATIPLFFRQSRGTIMPWDPAPELIVEGVYRYVRNPMHTGVFCVLFGEGLILRSVFILALATIAVLVHIVYIPYSEERGLEKRFGEPYRIYKQNVPRWIPRLTPWTPAKNRP